MEDNATLKGVSRIWLILILVALLLIPLSYTGFMLFQNIQETHTVYRVIDGDTLVLDTGETVRLLGIDTPEKGQPFYEEAKEYLSSRVKGKKITIEKDVSDKDKYDRLLRFIYIEGDMVNVELLSRGLAEVLIIKPDNMFEKEFMMIQDKARDAGIGIWSLQWKDMCLSVFSVHANAEGDDRKNLNDEYVEFRNKCIEDLDVRGWKLTDAAENAYIFKAIIGGKQTLTVHTGAGQDEDGRAYWNNKKPIWNNNSDTIFVFDKEGNKILEYEYGN